MNRSKIKQIKNKLYEAEGLVELLQLREDRENDLLPLLSQRIAELTAMIGAEIDELKLHQQSEEQPEEESALPDASEVTDSSEITNSSEFADSLEEDTAFTDGGEESNVESQEEITAPSDFSSNSDSSQSSDSSNSSETVSASENHASSETTPLTKTKQRPALCLNDRFRFRRALFGGNDDEFNAVIDRIATLADFEEAEDYIYGELGFEPDDDDVADFMEIIKSYFG